MVYNVLNRLKWEGGLEECEIVILHRGAPGDRMVVKGNSIIGVKRSYFEYRNRLGEEVTIPYHRILEVRIGGKVIWDRERRGK